MRRPEHYREQAQRARRLAAMVHQSDVRKNLLKLAQDFDEIAEDVGAGASDVRHPELIRCDE